MIKRYTKGDKDKVVTRVEQVSDITIHIPTSDRCMDYLYDGLMMLCNHYVADSDGDVFLMIPAIDFYNVVLFASKCCSEKEVDTQYISAMLGVVRTFTNLKYISVVFKDDIELRDSYDRLINMDSQAPNKVFYEYLKEETENTTKKGLFGNKVMNISTLVILAFFSVYVKV